MAENTFYVWVPLLSKKAGEGLIVGLVKEGLKVSALSSNNNLYLGNMLALLVEGEPPVVEAEPSLTSTCRLTRIATTILSDLKYSYHGIVVVRGPVEASWNRDVLLDPSIKPKERKSAIERLAEDTDKEEA